MAASAPRTSRLLIVDDEETNRTLLARRLRRRGYEVETVEDGPKALEATTHGRYDLVILDVMMPGMDGFTVLECLRERWSKLELPVLMATALDAGEDEVEALRLGANDYVTKPIDFGQLEARLATQLGLREEYLAMRGEAARKVRSTDAMAPGTVLDGRYEIEARIGHGGYAVVYRARQRSTGQLVAVKVLRAHRAMHSGRDGIEYARFRQEMQLIAAVRHPAVVQLIDSGSLEIDGGWGSIEDDREDCSTFAPGTLADSHGKGEVRSTPPDVAEVPYFVMEYLEGETLAEHLDQVGRLELELALELFFPVIDGVHALHRRGILHRDLKPSNILLHRGDHRGHQPKVLDFGIAKLEGGEAEPGLATIGFVGTPSYMSPEQALGGRPLDARCDQYALAVMLYECLCGRRPFVGENYTQILLAVTKGEYTPLAQLCEVPAAIDAVVNKAMSHEPTERFENLEDFAHGLLHAAPGALRSRWQDR
jgi:serine/threonine protein kinase/DNA-binding NarL/FixJ family response regulator